MARHLKQQSKEILCPCGGGWYGACCARFIHHEAVPHSAVELMRSRYSAYTLRDEDYLQATWHARTRPQRPILAPDDGVKWVSLEVLKHHQDGAQATVEFVARYKLDGRAQRLHEVSQFVREDGRWFYVEGSFPEK